MHRVVVLALVVLLAGCTAEQDPTVEAGGPGPETTSATTAPAVTEPPAAAAMTPPISTPPLTPRAYLTAVRAAASPEGGGATRVVFEFDPVVPGYKIDYIRPPVTEDGSGDAVTVAGEALLEVRMENAGMARLDGEKVIRTYSGPKRVVPSGSDATVTEVVDSGDFEGVVTWVVGLRQRVPAFTVSTLTGPSRLVIDVPAPQAR